MEYMEVFVSGTYSCSDSPSDHTQHFGKSLSQCFSLIGPNRDDLISLKFTKYTIYELNDILARWDLKEAIRAKNTTYAIFTLDRSYHAAYFSLYHAIQDIKAMLNTGDYHRLRASKRPAFIIASKQYDTREAYNQWSRAVMRVNEVNTECKEAYLLDLKRKMNILAESDPDLCTRAEAKKAAKALDNLIQQGIRKGKVSIPVPVFIDGFSGRKRRE